MIETLLIETERKYPTHKIMKQFSIYCWQENRENPKNGQINRGKTTVSFIFLNIGSYQCMYMCINVPW